MVYDKNLKIALFGGPSDIKLDLVQRLLEKQSNDVIVVGSGFGSGFGIDISSKFQDKHLVPGLVLDLFIPQKLDLQDSLSKLDSLFAPEPENFVFEIKNYFNDLSDVDLSFLDSCVSGFVDRNGGGVPDYVKFYGGSSGFSDLSYLYKKSNYLSKK